MHSSLDFGDDPAAKDAIAEASECGVTQAQRPVGLVEGNRFAPSIAAEITANKYAYHLPLYREQDLFSGRGLRSGQVEHHGSHVGL
jgi:hypothetical protein